jgi:acetyl-CoA carboxylase carboxyltransferase component
MSWEQEVDEIVRRRALAAEQGGPDGVSRQHNQGRLTIRERIDAVLDPGSFREIGPGAGYGADEGDPDPESFTPANFILGFGKIDGRLCIIGGEDFTLKGGSPSEAGLRKSVYAEELACKYKVPLIRLHEGGGGSVGGKGKSFGPPVFDAPRFRSVAQAMASVPVATAALGPVAGLPASRLVAAHFSVMSKNTAQILIAGPAVVERALGEKKTKEELGDHMVHTKNGVVDNAAEDEPDAFDQIRRFIGYLPQNVWELAPLKDIGDSVERCDDELLSIVPRDRRKAFSIRKLLGHVVDRDSFFEMGAGYGRGQVTGLARLNGQTVGILSNDCMHLAGAMTADGAHKVRRFVELCETFHLPILSFVDEPGFMIGSASEKAGTIRYGTAAVLTVALSSVPWACIEIRKSFGVAQAAHYGPDAYVLTWPSSESGALPVEGGVAVAYRREIEAADDPEARRRELEEQLAAKLTPFPREESLTVHEVIDPRRTRPMLCDWLERVQPLLPHLLGPSGFSVRP